MLTDRLTDSLWRRALLPRTRIHLSAGDVLATAAAILVDASRDGEDAVARFEAELAARVGRRHAVTVGSGKAALALAVDALALPPGSGVVVPALLVPEVVAVLLARGLEPIIVDVDENTFGLDAARVEAALTPETRAIVPVHLFGTPCAVDGIERLAEDRGLVLLEDAAQAIGAELAGRPVGSFGRVSTVSLGLVKNVNTLLGGAVLTDDDELADSLRAKRATWPPTTWAAIATECARWVVFGVVTRPDVFSTAVHPLTEAAERLFPNWTQRAAFGPAAGYTSAALDLAPYLRSFRGLQGRLGLRSLATVAQRNAIRARNAAILDDVLGDLPDAGIQRPPENGRSIRLNYPLLVQDRERRLPELRLRTDLDLAKGNIRDVAAVPDFSRYASDHRVAARVDREQIYVPVQHDVPPDVFRERAERLRRALGEG